MWYSRVDLRCTSVLVLESSIYIGEETRISSAVLRQTKGFGFWFQLSIQTSFSSAATLLRSFGLVRNSRQNSNEALSPTAVNYDNDEMADLRLLRNPGRLAVRHDSSSS